MNSILNLLPSECLVIRGGVPTKMTASNLVIGDIVQVKLGNKVPADLRLIQVSNDLKFDRAVLTGESEPVEGTTAMTDENFLESKNIALMGTHVVNGSGLGVVVLTGNNQYVFLFIVVELYSNMCTIPRQQLCHGKNQ